MEIIIEGRKVDTKDIWDITCDSDSRGIWVRVKITDKSDIVIGRNIPYDSTPMTVSGYKEPYRKLFKSIKEKWEADKSEIQVFKI